MKATGKTIVRLLPLLAILAVLPFSIWSCTKAGDEPEGPTGPGSQYNPEMDTPGAKIAVYVGSGEVNRGDLFALSAAFTDGDGRPVQGIPLTVWAETGTGSVVNFFNFQANPNITDDQGRISTHVQVDDVCPDGSYRFVVSSAPGGDGPVNGPFARGFAGIYVGSGGIETISQPDVPTGNTNPTPGVSATYYATGSHSSLGDPIQYIFYWGNGGDSGWNPADSVGEDNQSHIYNDPPSCPNNTTVTWTFQVTVKARCATHNTVVSPTSDPLTVTLTKVCPIVP